MDKLRLAEMIASSSHLGQLDKAGEPYIYHPKRMVKNAQTRNEKIVCWLHDVIEDTETTADFLRTIFDSEICDAVIAITKMSGEPNEKYYERVKSNELALKVKFLDIKDNMSENRLGKLDEKTQERLTKKYLKALELLTKVE